MARSDLEAQAPHLKAATVGSDTLHRLGSLHKKLGLPDWERHRGQWVGDGVPLSA